MSCTCLHSTQEKMAKENGAEEYETTCLESQLVLPILSNSANSHKKLAQTREKSFSSRSSCSLPPGGICKEDPDSDVEKKERVVDRQNHVKDHGPICAQLILGFCEVVFGTKLCLLLLSIPFTFVAVHLELGRGCIFVASLLAIAPLAERLGYVTEQLAYYTGPTMGGLLNATFGNATEMIIAIFALRQNLVRVVQLSLLGSILSNMLLVLGCAFFVGGVTHPQMEHQKFNKAAALVSSSLLLMAVMGLLFPAVLHATHTELHNNLSEITLSRFISVIMLVAYICYLYFQLKTHSNMYENESEGEEEEEEEEAVMGFWNAIFWLGVITIFISILSEFLVDAIEGAADMWHIPVCFISVVILPLVGNAAEHGSAIVFAMKDKLDISLGVAIGSSTQISMFVIPFCVVVGWAMGKDMNLDFEIFETATLFITVLVVAFLVQDGTANYFKGLMLILCYFIVGASFFGHVDVPDIPGVSAAKIAFQNAIRFFTHGPQPVPNLG